MLYSIIIPCYRSSKTIRKVVELTMKELEAIGKTEYEFVLVDDCSPDGGETLAALMGLVQDYTCVRVVELAKNAGQHNAVIAGLNCGDGRCVYCDGRRYADASVPAEISAGKV